MPQFGNIDAEVNNNLSRYDFAQILACARQLAMIRPVRLAYDSTYGATGYNAGQVLGRVTSTGLFKKYDDTITGGQDTAMAILFSPAVPPAVSGDSVLALGIFQGDVYELKCIGLDAAAKVDLKGRSIVDGAGTQIFCF